jgi:DNA-binding MarR family transcriptional regulator
MTRPDLTGRTPSLPAADDRDDRDDDRDAGSGDALDDRVFQLLSRHGAALSWMLRDPEVRIRDLARRIGTGERRTQAIVNDLVEAGLVERERVGRRNRYRVPSADADGRAHVVRPVLDLARALDAAGTGTSTDDPDRVVGRRAVG